MIKLFIVVKYHTIIKVIYVLYNIVMAWNKSNRFIVFNILVSKQTILWFISTRTRGYGFVDQFMTYPPRVHNFI